MSNPKTTSTSCSIMPLSALKCGMFCCTNHFLNCYSVLTAWLDIIPAHSWWNVGKQLRLITNLCICFFVFVFYFTLKDTRHFFDGGCFKLRFTPCQIWVSNLHKCWYWPQNPYRFFLCTKCGDSGRSQKAISDRMTICFIVLIKYIQTGNKLKKHWPCLRRALFPTLTN